MSRDFHALPVYQHRSEIVAALEQNQVLIVESPTGSGKTTQLPLILHEAGYTSRGMVGITQPRRIATLSVCDFISQQLQVSVGGFVGYKMRFEDQTGADTKIKVMTDGTLLQELKHDPLLRQYSVLMVDEAHERSLTIDFILGLLKDLLPKRPDFRLLVSSATIRTEVFSWYFYQAPICSIQAESYPVQVIYRPFPNESGNLQRSAKDAPRAPAPRLSPVEEVALQIRDLILCLEERQGGEQSKGDVLVFLPGEAHIKACLAVLLPCEQQHGLYALPLYARLSKEEQQRIFEDAPVSRQRPCRKVILATNIAETSLTIEGVTVVIDTGLAKFSHFDSYSQHAELREGNISKASAEQRKGRAGRVAPGICYRLYSRTAFREMRAYTQEEIQRTDLTEVILRMAELEIRDFEKFDFLTRPTLEDIRNAIDSLVQLGALVPRSHRLSEIGRQMCYFPLLPRHSRILIEALRISPECIHPACVITAFLSSSSPFLLPHGQEREAREAQACFTGNFGDFELYLRIFSHYSAMRDLNEKEQFCQRYFLEQRTMHELQRIVEQLKEIIRSCPDFEGIPIPEPLGSKSGAFRQYSSRYCEEYSRACLAGLQSGLCVLDEGGERRAKDSKDSKGSKGRSRRSRRSSYHSLTTRNIILHPGSSLCQKQPKYVLAGEVLRTSQTYARSVGLIEARWLDRFDPDLRKQLDRRGRTGTAAKSATRSKKDEDGRKAAEENRQSAAEQVAKRQAKQTEVPDPSEYLVQAGGKLWRIEKKELLFLGQSFPLLNRDKLLRKIRRHFTTGGSSGAAGKRSRHKQGSRLPHLVPHIQASVTQLRDLYRKGLLPDVAPELGLRLQFDEQLLLEGLMLSDVYRLLPWPEWGGWGAWQSQLCKEQGKLHSSYDVAKGRPKSERKALLRHLDLLFTPVAAEESGGVYGLDSDGGHQFWFRPFQHFGELLQISSLALEALAGLIQDEQLAANMDCPELPAALERWLKRCDSLY